MRGDDWRDPFAERWRGRVMRRGGVILIGVTGAVFAAVRRTDGPTVESRLGTAGVVVATRDVAEGGAFARFGLMVVQRPRSTIPAGAFSNVDEVVGRVARVNVYKGEPIVPGRLAPDGTSPGLEVKITPGKRAFGIRVDEASGVAGMVQPNSRVDIMVITSDEQGHRVAKLFMADMRVLAIGAVPRPSADGRPVNVAVATVEVTPDEAAALAIAANQGSFQLLLRGYGDASHESMRPSAATSTQFDSIRRNALRRQWVPTKSSAQTLVRRADSLGGCTDAYSGRFRDALNCQNRRFGTDSVARNPR